MPFIYYNLILFTWLAFSFQGCSAPAIPIEPTITNVPVLLGNSLINISIHTYSPDSGLVFIHLHDNEATAKQATHQTLQRQGGIFITVENNQNRLVQFSSDKKIYTFDPNRIFTPVGLKTNLQLFKSYTPFAVKEVNRFSSFLLSLIPQDATVIAIHNNTNNKYSVCSYLENELFKYDAKQVHVEGKQDPDDFFITTDETLYFALCKQHFNAVLLNTATSTNDGSLSKYFGNLKRPYVNIEAEHHHLEEQKIMLQGLINIIKKKE